MSIVGALRTLYVRHRIRRRRQAGRSVRLRVGDVGALFAEFDRRGVRYSVLRWFDEVPLTAAASVAFVGDVDVLVDDAFESEIAAAAARHPGRVTVELRSIHGRIGAFAGLPYYPPAFAEELLATRVRHPRGFSTLAPGLHVDALLFHLCYQKAEDSGIPTGVDGLSTCSGKRDYAALLRGIAADEGVDLPEPITLASIHDVLSRRGREMSFDLLARWPRETPWIHHLRRQGRRSLAAAARSLPGLIVLILRSDLAESLHERVLDVIRERYRVFEYGALDAAAQDRVRRRVRGGNWLVRPGAVPAVPTHYLLCESLRVRSTDASPGSGARVDEAARRVGEKRWLRERVRAFAQRAGCPARHGLHGSDDAFEAQHMLEAIFGDTVAEKRVALLDALTPVVVARPEQVAVGST